MFSIRSNFCIKLRSSSINLFIKKYNCKGINYPSKIDDWKTFEENIPAIALNYLLIKELYLKN